MCIYVQDIKFLWSNLWTGGLSTDDDDNDNANDDTWSTIHDCIGSSVISKSDKNGCQLKRYRSKWPHFGKPTLEAYVTVCVKYETSTRCVLRRAVHNADDDNCADNDNNNADIWWINSWSHRLFGIYVKCANKCAGVCFKVFPAKNLRFANNAKKKKKKTNPQFITIT